MSELKPCRACPFCPPLHYDYLYFWKKYRPELKGKPCRIVETGKKNSIEIEFESGERMITSRYAVRKRKENT